MIKEFQGPNRIYSNFWLAKVILDDEEYDSTEHAFQAAKTLDLEERAHIRAQATPGKAKREGRKITLRPDWEEVKLAIMYDLNFQKFSKNPGLRARLLATGDEHLQEGNYWNDTFWGVDLKTGMGQNHLGRILMKIRKELQEEDQMIIRVATCQTARWNKMDQTKVQEGSLVPLDVTRKSGDPHFAPSWMIITALKDGLISEEEYTEQYKEMMVRSYKNDIDHWENVIRQREGKTMVCLCYCPPPPAFCHRHLIAKYLSKVAEKTGYTVIMRGEL